MSRWTIRANQRNSGLPSWSAATALTAPFGILLGLPFEGGEYDDSFMLADIETNEHFPRTNCSYVQVNWARWRFFR